MLIDPNHHLSVADQLNLAGKALFPELLAMEVVSWDGSVMICRMPVRKALLAPNHYLHAAAVVGLADTACGYGTLANLPEGAKGFTTIELKSNFTGTARSGSLICRATPIHGGRLTQVWDAVVTHEETRKTIAHFRCTQMVLFEDLSDCLA
jgi:uncharacterized protein (TIGR00369 family)